MTQFYVPARQQALFIPGTGPADNPDLGHLFVILTYKCEDDLHLLVPICTQKKIFDRTCLLGKGDHNFLKKDSYVKYAEAKNYETSVLMRRVRDGTILYKGLMKDDVFALICRGLQTSSYTKPRFLTYYEENSKWPK